MRFTKPSYGIFTDKFTDESYDSSRAVICQAPSASTLNVLGHRQLIIAESHQPYFPYLSKVICTLVVMNFCHGNLHSNNKFLIYDGIYFVPILEKLWMYRMWFMLTLPLAINLAGQAFNVNYIHLIYKMMTFNSWFSTMELGHLFKTIMKIQTGILYGK